MQNFFPVNLICIWPYKKAISVGTPSFLGPPNVRLRPPNVRNFNCQSTQEGLLYPTVPPRYSEPSKKTQKITLKSPQKSKKSKNSKNRSTLEAHKKFLGLNLKKNAVSCNYKFCFLSTGVKKMVDYIGPDRDILGGGNPSRLVFGTF